MNDLPTPERFAGYRIVRLLGEGGSGRVYEAVPEDGGRPVALKLGAADKPDARARFAHEARIGAGLDHPNLVRLLDAGEVDGIPFLVHELLDGRDLDRIIAEDGEGLDTAASLRCLQQIAAALATLHDRGIVHGDVKPRNVRVGDDGVARLLDFGIARRGDQVPPATRRGVALGTVSALAPEQLRGEDADHRADTFAFGVLAYELLAGAKPFEAETLPEVFHRVLHEEPATLEGADLPAGAWRLVSSCLAKDPSRRPADLATVAAALGRMAELAERPSEAGPVPFSGLSDEERRDEERTILALIAEGRFRDAEAHLIERTGTEVGNTRMDERAERLWEDLRRARTGAAGELPVHGTRAPRPSRRPLLRRLLVVVCVLAALAAITALLRCA